MQRQPGSSSESLSNYWQEEDEKGLDWELAELRVSLAHHYANQKNRIYVEAPSLGRKGFDSADY